MRDDVLFSVGYSLEHKRLPLKNQDMVWESFGRFDVVRYRTNRTVRDLRRKVLAD